MKMFLFLGSMVVVAMVVYVLFKDVCWVIKVVWPEKLVQDLKIRFALARLVKRGVASLRELTRAVGEPSPRSCGAKVRTLNRLSRFGIRWDKTHNPERVRLSRLPA